jgi:hypothetical protein
LKHTPTRDPNRFAPIFVVTTARSYSSVITTMVGSHPQLADLPELKLFCSSTLGELEHSLPRYWRTRGVTHRSPGLVRAVAQCEFGGQDLGRLSAAREWLHKRPDWRGEHVFDVLMEHLSPRVAVEKSPDNILTDEGLRRMTAAYPRARYLHLTRHPITTQRSIMEHRRRTVPQYPLEGEPVASIASWYEIHRRILVFAETLPSERYLRVRSEDVLNDSLTQLRSITDWLGIRADDDAIRAMQHPEVSPFACRATESSGVTGGNDPQFLRDPVPHRVEIPPALERPPGWDTADSVWQMIATLARRFGYGS